MATENTIPLNRFRLVTTQLGSGSNVVYQKDEDLSTILLSAAVTNVSSALRNVSVQIQKSGSLDKVTLLNETPIPISETLNPFPGKIILERNDALVMDTAFSQSLEVVISLLENANN